MWIYSFPNTILVKGCSFPTEWSWHLCRKWFDYTCKDLFLGSSFYSIGFYFCLYTVPHCFEYYRFVVSFECFHFLKEEYECSCLWDNQFGQNILGRLQECHYSKPETTGQIEEMGKIIDGNNQDIETYKGNHTLAVLAASGLCCHQMNEAFCYQSWNESTVRRPVFSGRICVLICVLYIIMRLRQLHQKHCIKQKLEIASAALASPWRGWVQSLKLFLSQEWHRFSGEKSRDQDQLVTQETAPGNFLKKPRMKGFFSINFS